MKISTIGQLLEANGWAMAGPLRSLNISRQYYYAGLALLIVMILIAAVKVYRVWEELQDVEEPDSPEDLLHAFEEARAAGEIDDAEMERVRARLGYGKRPADKPKAPDDPGVK